MRLNAHPTPLRVLAACVAFFPANVLQFVERMRVRVLDEYLDLKFAELDNQRLQMQKQIDSRERRINLQVLMRGNT